MVSSSSIEPALKPSDVPKTIANLLKDVSKMEAPLKKLVVLDEYIYRLEQELNSIAAFKHLIPQCVVLLMEALETLKCEFMNIKNGMRLTESEGALMEFLADKRKQYGGIKGADLSTEDNQKYDFKGKGLMSSSFLDDRQNPNQRKAFRGFIQISQASNQNPITFNRSYSRFASTANGTTNNNGEVGLNLMTAGNPTLNIEPKPLTQPIWKSKRRSWTPQLHSRFVEVLHQLGGIKEATPKQIKEMMKVEGLTNDHVKSHLQKYRLHCRRLAGSERNAQGLLGINEDPWHPQIYNGDPLVQNTPMKNNSNPGGSSSAAGNLGSKSCSGFN